MLPYIKENFETGKKIYTHFKFNEDVIIECMNN